jgi:uncharacterized protein (DUF1499 family)
MIELRTLKRPTSRNHYLIAPKDFIGPAGNEEAPVFPMPAAKLFQVIRKVVSAQPRTVIVEEDASRMALEAYQKTPLLHFTDDATIEAMPLGSRHSTLALYSRSRVGYTDFGTNRRRARLWLAEIAKNAGAGQEPS